jgi:hypothetical protein
VSGRKQEGNFTFFRKKVMMKSFIIGLIVLLGISNSADAQFFVMQPQVRYYNNGYNYNYGYNYRFNNYGYNNGYNNYGYNNGYNNLYLYGQNNNWYNNGYNNYVTPSGYMPFNNPYFRMATQGIGGYGW